MMILYRCCLFMDLDSIGDSEWKGIWADSSSEAAEMYADYVHYNRDGWEMDNEWDGEDSVVVETPEGTRRAYKIIREWTPSFTALRDKTLDLSPPEP